MAQEVEILPHEDKDLFILHSQYMSHGYRCPGSLCHQGISTSSNGIDLIHQKYSRCSTRNVDFIDKW